ncbi:hypothetical protein DENSPDRAFT_272758 [Dentipellis sp. KUC8613]|nr:hypothetical protein DENSPDRAFT_272758 [Dentipellis sp. KUC8613]
MQPYKPLIFALCVHFALLRKQRRPRYVVTNVSLVLVAVLQNPRIRVVDSINHTRSYSLTHVSDASCSTDPSNIDVRARFASRTCPLHVTLVSSCFCNFINKGSTPHAFLVSAELSFSICLGCYVDIFRIGIGNTGI